MRLRNTAHGERPTPKPFTGAEYFALTPVQVRSMIREVAIVTATWRDTARVVGAPATEIDRMASAFEHDDLDRALALP